MKSIHSFHVPPSFDANGDFASSCPLDSVLPTATPNLVPGRSANAAHRIRFEDMPIKVAAVPFPLPFLQAPPQGQERSSPVPVNIPFLNVHDIDDKDKALEKKLDDEEDELEDIPSRPSFFERLLGSLKPIRSQKPFVLPTEDDDKSSQSASTTQAPSSVTATAQPSISIKVVAPKSRQLSDLIGDVQPIGVRLPLMPPNFQNLRIPIVLRPEDRTNRMIKDDAVVMPHEEEHKENIDRKMILVY